LGESNVASVQSTPYQILLHAIDAIDAIVSISFPDLMSTRTKGDRRTRAKLTHKLQLEYFGSIVIARGVQCEVECAASLWWYLVIGIGT
jgi:hypothetical protein